MSRSTSADLRNPDLRRRIPSNAVSTPLVLAGLLALALASALAVRVALAPSAMGAADRAVNTALREPAVQWTWLAEVLRVLAEIGAPAVATLTGTLFGIALLLTDRRGWLVYFVVAAVGGVVITEVTKRLVQRPRPQWPDPLAIETSFSFPSGHTTSGITMWVTMGIVLLLAYDRRGWRTALGWLVIAFGVALGLDRLLLGVHWVTDVLGGWLFGCGWLLFVSGFVLRVHYRSPNGRTRSTS